MSESNRFMDAYRQEAEELLSEIEQAILDIEDDPEDREAVNRLFRCMHTIKGSGSMFGFDAIAEFTHHVETVLDKVRAGLVPVSKRLIDLVLASRDQIMMMLNETEGHQKPDTGTRQKIIESLNAMLFESENDKTLSAEKDIGRPPSFDTTQGKDMTYRIRFRPNREIFSRGMDPALLLDELREMGDCSIMAHTDGIPSIEKLDPESCYLYWDIILVTAKGINAVRDIFIFVEDDCDIRIDIVEAAEQNVEEPVPRLGEILVERGDVIPETVTKALSEQKKIGELLVDSGSVSRGKVESALIEQQRLEKQRLSARVGTVRVPSDRLDKLVNLVGELVITQARLSQVSADMNHAELVNPVEEIERLTTELRDSVLNIRMMPIGTTFSKFRRLVRDLSAELGKDIALITEGAETELDKTVIERLDDPLVHMIRNCIDHGIEPPAERKKKNKPETGTIRLAAAHKGANVVITIEDDGIGLDPDAIRLKAIEKGLIPKEAELTEKEILSRIFAPGFSTSEKITNLSGRGVGMDVVKKTIESLRGTVDVSSVKGKGTCITLKLPLTLAIINGLLVTIGDSYYVLPLATVEECTELTKEDVEKAHGANIMNVRGEIVPYVRLRDHFEMKENKPDLEHIVIADVYDKRIGFVVDHVVGGHQTVIKSLGPAFKGVKDVSGATILGDGTVALILDVNALV
ncbi:MAG: chemotaxis protein CheA [Deltaproteobacteria bacterium]|nr:chemotaxis protein CheA [Deltaproteobacteria bacterium]